MIKMIKEDKYLLVALEEAHKENFYEYSSVYGFRSYEELNIEIGKYNEALENGKNSLSADRFSYKSASFEEKKELKLDIFELEDAVSTLDEYLGELYHLKRQVLVEEYKDLNRDSKLELCIF